MQEAIRRAMREIRQDAAAGIVPRTVRTFSELHDHVDANGYGGAFDNWDDERDTDAHHGFWSAVQDAVHEWLAAGALARPATPSELA
jgi:hypothetical protein